MTKVLYIMRGIPGAGKSTRAREIAKSYSLFCICSADHFFEDDKGNYSFNPKLLSEAHKYCRELTDEAMCNETPCVIVDNTNTREWEFKPYLELADKYGYKVHIEVVGDFDDKSILKYAERNTHGVPAEKVIEMARRFEW